MNEYELFYELARRLRNRAALDVALVQSGKLPGQENVLYVLGRAQGFTIIAEEIEATMRNASDRLKGK